MKIKPRLIIGLGNPAREYKNTYHNVGILAIDFLAKNPVVAKLLKSDSYMNQSGLFVRKVLKKYGAKPEEILITHDDSDIKLGQYKISFGRGSAGHKGVESIIKVLKTKNFWRLRIGIRRNIGVNQHTPSPRQSAPRPKAKDLVLKKISRENLKILLGVFGKAKNELYDKT